MLFGNIFWVTPIKYGGNKIIFAYNQVGFELFRSTRKKGTIND